MSVLGVYSGFRKETELSSVYIKVKIENVLHHMASPEHNDAILFIFDTIFNARHIRTGEKYCKLCLASYQ